jgi:hypothetical protein
MQIDRSNYEIWFTDWLDGNLDSLQVKQLKLFLDRNPELREELNDLAPLKLASSAASYRYKEHLKKSLSDITDDQFDYLCSAYLENDLSDSQKTELHDIVNSYPDRKKTFELIQKTTLTPPVIKFRHKGLLLRRTTLQNVLRVSAIGLSAAAAISLIIILYSVTHGTTSFRQSGTAHNFTPDTAFQRQSEVVTKEKITAVNTPSPVPAVKKRDKNITAIHHGKNVVVNIDTTASPSYNLPALEFETHDITVTKIPVFASIDLQKEAFGNKLIASAQETDIPAAEDERSRVGKFISKTFREKLLKEKKPKDTPLNGFDIAEAGITGLNKLFGWQMALEKRNDENGQPKSVYFSSEILKFNAPLKKREPQQ